ncbi:hypothetical protein [Moritella dasanensis]|uniref:hypothetical protein n=1 Tax=Moritella dasanensis TaxID=428031 RepID=UPI000382DCE3|nr:hypothetical protein [Moritella dasanensis]
MHKILIPLLLLSSTSALANTVHISPEIKIGPYEGTGISGAGLQLGLTDTFGLDAVYLSYSHTSAQFLYLDNDRLKTYRIGAQKQLVNKPKMSLQLEAGWVEYEGKQRRFGSNDMRYSEATGVSISASWVIAVTDNIAFRAGTDINYIDRDKTFLPYDLSAMFSTGIIFSF